MRNELKTETTDYPIVQHAEGGPSYDGKALLIEAATAEGGSVRFALNLADVQHLVAFLLVSVGKISAAQQNNAGAARTANRGSRPIPVTSFTVGEPEGEEGYIEIAVGQAELVFSIPISSFDLIGRTMMTASVRPTDGRVT